MKLVCTSIILLGMSAPVFAEEVAIPPTSTPEQIEAFKDADDNSDGALTPPEFALFIEAMADQGEPTAKFIRTLGVHSVAFAKVDQDGDGYARPFEISNANRSFENGDDRAFGTRTGGDK